MTNPPNISLWIELAQHAGLRLDEAQISRLQKFLDLMLQANEKMNLTRITDRSAAEILHIADTLTLLPFLPRNPHNLADVGSGGGVPGIVLAIVRPDAFIFLIESTKKKADFLQVASTELNLKNVTVDSRRVEEIGRSNLKESFDVAVARAVATMDWLTEWMLPLVKKGGTMLAMKGKKAQEELNTCARTIRMLGGGTPAIESVQLPGADHHAIIRIPKTGRTDARYPRLPSIAKGRPLSA